MGLKKLIYFFALFSKLLKTDLLLIGLVNIVFLTITLCFFKLPPISIVAFGLCFIKIRNIQRVDQLFNLNFFFHILPINYNAVVYSKTLYASMLIFFQNIILVRIYFGSFSYIYLIINVLFVVVYAFIIFTLYSLK